MPSDAIEHHTFSEDYLLRRPLLEAISQRTSPVLLIDEIDRADEEFEAFLHEILSDSQITVPELGTIAARSLPREETAAVMSRGEHPVIAPAAGARRPGAAR